MSVVFADTSFYQALLSKRDNQHDHARETLAQLDAGIVTTEYVFIELGSLMSYGPARGLFVRLLQHARNDSFTELVPASAEIFNAGFTLFADRPDKNWSLVDCISFQLMRQRRIQDVLTYDHHF